MDSIHRDIFKGNIGASLKRQVYNSCVKTKLAAAQTKAERSVLNVTYRDRKTNIWV